MTRDPYKYFRIEAHELVPEIGKGALDLEKAERPQGVVARLLRLAHTLKGAARVVKQPAIADLAHSVEDVLEPYRDESIAVPRSVIDRVLSLVDAMGAHVAALPSPEGDVTSPEATPRSGPAAPAEHVAPTIRADLSDLDDLLEGIAEAHVHLASLRREVDTVGRMHRIADALATQLRSRRAPRVDGLGPRTLALAEELRSLASTLARSVGPTVEQTDRELRQAREHAERLRLLPARVVFDALERTSRDTAHALGKRVTFHASGGDVRLDAQVLTVAQGALVQLVRNAVSHGIEEPAVRESAGKPPRGRVAFAVRQRGSQVTFACTDDGRGVDLAAVRRVAERRGARFVETPPSAETLVSLLLEGGVSTSGEVTEISGRGVGMDVVRECAERLGGRVSLRTEEWRGTTVEIAVPVSLASVPALVVHAGGQAAAIPLDSVRRTLSVAPSDVARGAGGESIVFEGNVIPLRPLARSLRSVQTAARSHVRRPAVVVEGGGALAAVAVDRLIGTSNVVLRPMPELAPVDAVIAGASLDAEGNPQLVLDADALVASAHGESLVDDDAQRTRLPILVVDDSLTTRMLEQSVLESAGYAVELAACAEDALEMAKERSYALFLVDVEMPGMDGFSFVAATRADPELRRVPAILVTSRSADEDRERGRQVGAVGYIVKSEFDQTELLDQIHRLVESA